MTMRFEKFTNIQNGYIYDRHDKLLVANQPTYDLMVVPRGWDPRYAFVLQAIKN